MFLAVRNTCEPLTFFDAVTVSKSPADKCTCPAVLTFAAIFRVPIPPVSVGEEAGEAPSHPV